MTNPRPGSLWRYWRRRRYHPPIYDPAKYGYTHTIRVNIEFRSAQKGLSRDNPPVFQFFHIYRLKGERALLDMFYRLQEELQGFEREVDRINDPIAWRLRMKRSRERWRRLNRKK